MVIYTIFITLFFITSILLAKKFNLYDYPNSRKNHLIPVINIGGFPLIFSFFSAYFLFDYSNEIFIGLIFSLFFLILGFVDDRKNLSPFVRIFIQFLLSLIFLYLTDIRLINIYLNKEIILPSYLSYFFSACCILVIINSFNYFDGLDFNLIFITISLTVCIYFFFNFFSFYHVLILIVPMIIFSILNHGFKFLPKMYLGDSGSNFLGFFFASIFLLINKEMDNTFETQHTIIWLLAFPSYEFLATTISRKIRKKKIFEPGKDHVHYLINKFTNNALLTAIINVLILISIFLIGFFIMIYIPSFSFGIFILLFFIYFFIREKLITRC